MPLVQAAAGLVAGPLGFVVAPAIATTCLWAGARLGGESEAAKAVAEALSHVFGHLGGDAVKGVLSSLRQPGNHDLERAIAVAARNALAESHQQLVRQRRIDTDSFDGWFSLWRDRVDRALETPEDTVLLFPSDYSADPVTLADGEEDQWWPLFEPLLLRWANEEQNFAKGRAVGTSALPAPLAEYCAKNLLNLMRQALREVLRDDAHERGWIAWQQRFLEAIAQQTRASHADVAQQFDNLARREEDLRLYLKEAVGGVHQRFDKVDGSLIEIAERIDVLQRSQRVLVATQLYPTPDLRFVSLDGKRLQDLRHEGFGSRGALAGVAGVAEGVIARAEKGQAIQRAKALLVAQALRVELRELLPKVPALVSASDEGFPEWDPFGGLIEEKTNGFIGREYVLSAIDAFVGSHPKGYCIVEGDPGMGKSSILAEWVLRKSCLAFFNVRSMGINRASQFLESICSQIVRRFGLPYTQISSTVTQDGAFLSRLLTEASSRLSENEKIIIAVDALDEVDLPAQSAGSNILYLPSYLPNGVFFVMTRRKNFHTPLAIQAPQHIIDLLNYPVESRDDIRAYVGKEIDRPRLREWIERSGVGTSRFVEALADKSENNFMYLHYVLPEIESGTYRNLSLERLPVGLEGYYEDHWRLMGMMERPLKRSKIKIVYILAEVRQPVSRRLIADFSQEDAVTVQETLDEWGQFLHQATVGEGGTEVKRYSVYHTSFRDFLQRKDILQAADVNIPRINAMIADNLFQDLFGDGPSTADS